MHLFAELHLPTLFFIMAAVILILAGTHVMVFVFYPEMPGVKLCALGNALFALPIIALFLLPSGLIPAFSIFFNTLMTSGFLLIYLGIREYTGNGVQRGRLLLILAVFSGTFALFSSFIPWAFRTVTGLFTLGVFSFMTAWEAHDGFRRTRPARLIFAGIFCLHGLFLLVFTGTGLDLALSGKGALGQNPGILGIVVIEGILAALAVNLSYILLIADLLSSRLARKAETDYLTGTYNRRGIIQIGEAMGQEPLSMIIADLDLFKKLNDKYGHAAGDKVLKNFADTVGRNLRPWDVLGRFGGEEFLILLPQLGAERASRIAERLRWEIEKTEIPWERQPITYTVSMGISSRDGTEAKDLNRLIAEADEALYSAKGLGRNKVVRFDSGEVNVVMPGLSNCFPVERAESQG